MIDTPPAADVPAPQRTLLVSRGDYYNAAEQVITLAQHELRVFDPDLQEFRLDTKSRIELLRAFLLRSTDNRLYISVRDPSFIKQFCPRLITLLAQFSTSMFIWEANGEATKAQDCFVLADQMHVVRRPVALQPRGVFILNDPREGLVMYERFREIWDTSAPSVSASTSGL